MLSLRNRDELGFGSREGAMEENELEEGEAFSCHDDEIIDPDVALSYLDEKLQDVLGHFQKDFEGGVSAENLGAKFGGYGSFLPTYQRSPAISSQPKSPLKPPNHTASKSPYNSSVECAKQNSLVIRSTPVTKINSAPVAQNSCAPNVDSGKFKSVINSGDQKSLKVRIKVGPDNTLARNTAAIYSGLGLDTSPFSSPEDSLDACRGSSLRVRDAPGDSPSTILQAMTSFSVPGGYLLSPLKEIIFKFTEKDGLFSRKADKLAGPNTTMPMNQMKNYSEKKKKIHAKKDRAVEEEDLNCIGDTITTRTTKKETGIDASTSKKVLYSSLNGSLQSCSRSADSKSERQIISDSTNGFRKAFELSKDISKSVAKDGISLPDSAKDDLVISMYNSKTANSKGKLKSKTSLSEKEAEDRNPSDHIDNLSDTSSKGKSKKHKNYDMSKLSGECRGFNDNDSSLAEPSKQTLAHNIISHEKHAEKMLQGIEQKQEGQKRQKGSHNNYTLPVESIQTREKLKTPSSMTPKEKKKNSHSKNDYSVDKYKSLLLRKETKKGHSRESNRDVAQRAENTGKSLERKSGTKKDVNIHSEPLVNNSSAFTSNSDAAVALDAPPPVVINENWVCCDNCQMWRLLPYGQDPQNLPKKWLCNMQVWLPGLNRCYISEDETTKAFNAQYLVPAPEAGAILNGHYDIVASTIYPANNTQQSDQVFDQDMQISSTLGKKKTGSSNEHKNSDLKKNLQSSIKTKTLMDMSDYPLQTSLSVKAVPSKSTDFTAERNVHKLNNRREIQGRCSDGAVLDGKNSKDLKSKSKREVSQDGFKSSKKTKTENSDNDKMRSKFAPGMDCGLSAKATGKIMRNYSDHSSSKDSRREIRGNSSASVKKSKDIYSNGNIKDKSNLEKSDSHDYAAKKRKVKEWQESQQAQKDTATPNKQLLYVKECSVEGEPRKQKRAKLSKSEEKERNNMINSNEKVDKKDCFTKTLLPTAATTSSSSKVSSSRKSKVNNLHDVRGSPVESVSSSPLKTSINERLTIRSCKAEANTNDMVNADSSLVGSPKRCSDAELGSDQSGTQLKEISTYAVHLKLKEASRDGSNLKKVANSHHSPAEFQETNDVGDAEKDNINNVGLDKSNNHRHSNGNISQWKPVKEGRNKTCNSDTDNKVDVSDSDSKKKELYSIKNGSSNCNFNSNIIEVFRDDKKSETSMNHQSVLNGIDNRSEIVLGNKRTLLQSIQPSKDKSEAQSSGSRAVIQTPTNIDATSGHALKFAEQSKNSDSHNGVHLNNSLKQAIPNGRDCNSMTANAVLKEARTLKHSANRMKNEGNYHDSLGMYFEAALKFLHCSFLLEPVAENPTRHGETNSAMTMLNMYSDTARLFEYCAHEYEKIKEMAGVALAYKCVEVAYMKVAYYKHATASKDRHELQTALQTILPGDSPSSSASDVDNLNNHGALDKVASVKAASSPQITGNHIIAARHHPNFMRLLEYTNYMNSAFDATKRSQNAIAAASVSMERDGVDRLGSVRLALDFNFHNVEGLLRLIRISKDSINL